MPHKPVVKKVFFYFLFSINPYTKMASDCLIHECFRGPPSVSNTLHYSIILANLCKQMAWHGVDIVEELSKATPMVLKKRGRKAERFLTKLPKVTAFFRPMTLTLLKIGKKPLLALTLALALLILAKRSYSLLPAVPAQVAQAKCRRVHYLIPMAMMKMAIQIIINN